jgi:UDP-N-acetylglucosamine 2-epimerase (non-hydrolysing)
MEVQKKLSLLFVYGTRPEAIKVIPVIKHFLNFTDRFEVFSCNSGQHNEMVYQVENYLGYKADYNLNLMTHNQTLSDLSSNLLTSLQNIFNEVNPEIVFVQGDTTTAFISGLVAFYNKSKIAHIEAGLRSYDKYSPWPEEMNRKMLTALADYNFVPTLGAKQNLLIEGITESTICVTGNTGIDSLKYMINKLQTSLETFTELNYRFKDKMIDIDAIRGGKKLILITVHRRENFGNKIKIICCSIRNLALAHPEILFIWPVHLNPNIKNSVQDEIGNEISNLILTEPLGYLEFLELMSQSFLIFTDSGGIQEEAPSLGKRVVVLRDKTERPEGLNSEFIKMAGDDYSNLNFFLEEALNEKWSISKKYDDIYGDGHASRKIVEFITDNNKR